MSLQRGQVFDSRRSLTRDDVRFLTSDGWVRYSALPRGATPQAARVMMRPCKKLRYSGGKSVPVILYDGSLLQPVTELLRLFQFDGVPDAEAASTPLFRRDSGAAYTTDYVREVVRYLMKGIGLPPRLYGGHSLRIGGASAALAAGVSEATIRAMGRWDSDIYEMYLRHSLDGARRTGTVIASTAFEDFEGMFDHEELVRVQPRGG